MSARQGRYASGSPRLNKTSNATCTRVLAPLSRRLAKHPVLRQDDLVDARRRWLAIDPIARLYDSVIDISDRRNPSFLDVRVWPSRYKGWDGRRTATRMASQS
jgi:hypothetical protein